MWRPLILALLLRVVVAAVFILPWFVDMARIRDWVGTTRASVTYTVTFDEGEAEASVTYQLPSGDMKHEVVTTPWRSQTLVFHDGGTMSLSAESRSTPPSFIRCEIRSSSRAWTEGFIGNPKGSCHIDYRLGPWPPDDLTGSLIQVG